MPKISYTFLNNQGKSLVWHYRYHTLLIIAEMFKQVFLAIYLLHVFEVTSPFFYHHNLPFSPPDPLSNLSHDCG